MIRRLFVLLVFCFFFSILLASTPNLATHYSSAKDSENHLPHETFSRMRSNSKKNLHISIGTVEVRRLDLESRQILSQAEETETDLQMLFLTARHGNEEDFKLHLDVYRAVTSPEEMQHDLAFGPTGHSIVIDAIHGDNPVIFDAVLQLEDWRVEQMIELESDDSDTDADEEDDLVTQGGLRHVSGRPRKHSHGDDISLWDRISGRKNGPLPRSYTLGTKLLRFAIFHSATSIVEHLIKVHGVRDEMPNGFQSALHMAVDGGHQNLIPLLLECGGSRIDARDHNQVTPLELAWKKEFDRVAATLIIYGADFSAQDCRLRNSVFHASQFGQVSLLKFMAERAAENGIDFQQLALNPERHTLNTALHICVDQKTFDFFKDELKMKIDTPLNTNNETPEEAFYQAFFK